MASHTPQDSGLIGLLADLVATYRQLSAFSAEMFEPIARLYVGNLANRLKLESSVDVVNLALKKLLYEAGELLTAPAAAPAPGGPVEEKKDAEAKPSTAPRDARTHPADVLLERQAAQQAEVPDLKLAYLATAVLAYMKRRDEREAAAAERADKQMMQMMQLQRMQQPGLFVTGASVRGLRYMPRGQIYGGTQQAFSLWQPAIAMMPYVAGSMSGSYMPAGPTGGYNMPVSGGYNMPTGGAYNTPVSGAMGGRYDVRATKGCGCGGGCGCNGGGTRPPPPRPPCYDPCGGGIYPVPPSPDICRPGCSCSSCQGTALVPAVPGLPEKCPPFFSISCETQRHLKDCIKIALCELLKTYVSKVPACQPNAITTSNPSPIVLALQKALCSFLQCLPDRLCPTPQPVDCGPKVPMKCLPCDYAVEWPTETNPEEGPFL